MMIFKVDFEKVFDSVNWKYLDYVLSKLWFGEKWRSWIRECLRSARTSILVNGSPTSEFSIKRGLRQGDPLSQFLFSFIIEGLHIAIKDATRSNLIKGVTVGNPASGLRININKSNVYGIGVSNNDIEGMARITGCSAGSFLFTYLGLPIGLSSRLTLVHAILGSVGIYYMSIFKVLETIISSLERLRSKFFWGAEHHSNKLIMIKWENALASFEGGGGETHPNCNASDRFSSGEWACHWSRPITSRRCLDMIHSLKAELHSLSPSTDRDPLRWGLTHDVSFTVGATRKHIDDVILPTLSVEISWCNILPRKVNILIWRIRLDRLPHRLNLSKRGLDTHSIDCPICSNVSETSDHIFNLCDVASNIWRTVRVWVDLDMHSSYSHSDWEFWFDNIRIYNEVKKRIQVIAASTWWILWKYRNSITFNSKRMRKCDLFDNIRFCYFSWLNSRDIYLRPVFFKATSLETSSALGMAIHKKAPHMRIPIANMNFNRQYESSPEFGNASGSGGFGDDEIADDEDDGEDEEDEEDDDS
uniref:RNA-directed DNA polymerase, eukaryota n=1 Tax=Tanacetum cinerariifolium TaxID=118510 RepID=A0A6L2LS76_TANCI|nr:hypothetical protein [Tanacetum cinerariifolium]